jgi:hypothetical protein
MVRCVFQWAAVAIILMGSLLAPSGMCLQSTPKVAHSCCLHRSGCDQSVRTSLILAASVLCLGQTESPASSMPVPAGRPLSVDEAVTEALEANPEIRALVRRLSLAQLKTTTARSLDDPMFMVRDWDTPLRKPWDMNQAQLMFSVQQTFLSKRSGICAKDRGRRCGSGGERVGNAAAGSFSRRAQGMR